VVLVVVILGIMVIGSPAKQRNVRFDNQRVSDLQSIQYAITDYYRANNKLPVDLDILTQGTTYYVSSIKDPVTKVNYEYAVTTANKYKICATFSLDSQADLNTLYQGNQEIWTHSVGQTCFERIAGDKFPPKAVPEV
jgi:hypothetical protein